MALYVRNPEVVGLVKRLAALRGVSRTEAVRQALLRELGETSRVGRGVAFVAALKARARPDEGAPADKGFVDSLYD